MFRKILIILILLAFIFPGQALANDAFWYDYDSSNLKIIVNRIQDDFSIGEDYLFEVTVINITEWKLLLRQIDCFLFPNNCIYFDDIVSESEMTLMPGERVTFTCTTEVPYNISWRKKDGDFYYDLILEIGYSIHFSDKEDDWVDASSVSYPAPITINNLYDGSRMLEMKYVSGNNQAIFKKNWDNLNNEEYRSKLENTIIIKNVYDTMLQNLIIHGLYEYKEPLYIDRIPRSVFLSSHIGKETLKSYYGFIKETIPNKLTDRHQAIFMVDGKYYAAELQKNIEMILGISPEISFYPLDSQDETMLTVKIENDTSIDFANFYFGKKLSVESDNVILDQSNILSLFKKGSSKEYTIERNSRDVYCIGYTTDGYFFSWDVSLNIYDDNIYMHLSNDAYHEYIFESELTASPTNTSTTEPIPTQTPYPTETVKTSPVPSDEAPTIEITEIQKSSSIPFWVWYVLAVVVITGAVIIIILRKNKKDESKYE